MENNSDMIHEPKSILEATQRDFKILDAKYEHADLGAAVNKNCNHLSIPNHEKLVKLLAELEDLFDQTLDDWDTECVSLKVKEGVIHIMTGPFQPKRPQRNPERRGSNAM
jgi:hypothetical protein